MKNSGHGFTENKLLSVKPCMLFFIQTLSLVLCAGAVRGMSFLDLFGPIAGVTNLIMQSLPQQIGPQLRCIMGYVQIVHNCSRRYLYIPVHLVESVRNHNQYMRVEEAVACIAYDWMLGAGVIMKHTRNYAMHNVCVIGECKTPSHTQSTVPYWVDEVNRGIGVICYYLNLKSCNHLMWCSIYI